MGLLAYAVRRTVEAVIVFLVVVLLTMFAVASIDTPPLRGDPWRAPQLVDLLRSWGDGWGEFPSTALAAFSLVTAAAVVRRRATR